MSFDIHIPTPEKKALSWDGDMPEMGISAHWRLILRNRDGSIARDTGWFKNVITNVGMSRIVRYDDFPSTVSWLSYLAIGNGTGTPAFTDTALFGSQLGDRQVWTGGTVTGFAASYFYSRTYARWPTGNGTGTISEVAGFSKSTGGEMFNHALLVDSGGSPTTIVKGADQSLDVYLELRNYPNLSDVSGTIDISGTSYDYVIRPYYFTAGSIHWSANAIEDINSTSTHHWAYTNQGLIATNTQTVTGSSLGYATGGVPYAKGSYYTDNYIEANIDNWIGEIDWFRTLFGNTAWQGTLTKTVGGGGLVKTDEERLRLHIRSTVTRH